MKVSAPQFMSSSAPPAPDASTPSDTPADPAAPPPPPKPAVWPGWFPGLDNMLLVCALLFAFLITSFAARNPDLFRHIASGQRLLSGKYSLGSDPFTYTGAERPWVNQSWLFDLGTYTIYSLDSSGAALVVFKAVVFAASFGILLWFRRPGQSGWPWALLILLAALGSSSVAYLRPLICGMFFFSLLLLVVFQSDWQNRAGRMLAFVGGICWLWGGFDNYVILAPIVLGTMGLASLVFAFLDAKGKAPEVAVAEDSVAPSTGTPAPADVAAPTVNFLPAPPAKLLLLATAISVLAILLNPTFVIGVTKNPVSAVEQLIPVEFSFGIAEIFSEDQEYKYNSLSLISASYWELDVFGRNIPSLGLFLIVVLGAIALSVGFGQPPVAMIALWFVSLGFTMISYRFTPFFLLAAIPLVGGLLNALSGRFSLTTEDDPRSRALLASSRLGRILSVPLFLLMLAATIPGILNPRHLDSAQTRRIDWRINADEAFIRGVKQIQEWRDNGELPAHIRGMHVNPEFGDYAALFAPDEKVFVNTRFRFHASELPDLETIRALVLWPPSNAQNESRPMPTFQVGDKYNVNYLVVGRPNRAIDRANLILSLQLLGFKNSFVDSIWQLDGRTLVMARSNTAEMLALNQKLHINPLKMAFGPQTVLPDGPAVNTRREDAGWLGELLEVPPPPRNYVNDVMVLLDLGMLISQQDEDRTVDARTSSLAAATGVGVVVLHPRAIPNRTITDYELAIPLVAIRTARLAVAQTPDDEMAYFHLARAFSTPRLPEFRENDIKSQRLTALARFLNRVPDPQDCPTRLLQPVLEALEELFLLQFELQQIDAAFETVKKLSDYLEVTPIEALQTGGGVWQLTANTARRFSPLYDKHQKMTQEKEIFSKQEFQFEEQAKKSGRNEPPSVKEFVKKFEKAVSRLVSLKNEAWVQNSKAAGWKPGIQAIVAASPTFGLHVKSLTLLQRATEMNVSESGLRNRLDAQLTLIKVNLELGRVETADELLRELEAHLEGVPDFVRQQFLQHKFNKLIHQGSYTKAIETMDDMRGPNSFPKLNENERLLASLRPDLLSILLSGATGPIGSLVPRFQPPQNTPPEAAAAMEAAFIKNTANSHPVLVGNMHRQALFAESMFYYQRGILALYAGELQIARESFFHTLFPQSIPLPFIVGTIQDTFNQQGSVFNLSQFMPSFLFIQYYMSLIDRFQPPKPGK